MPKLLKYHQAKLRIMDMIAEKSLCVGDKLPTQSELLRGGNFSLICLKRALSELAGDGIIELRRGGRAVLLKKFTHRKFWGTVLFVYIYRYSPNIDESQCLMSDKFASYGIRLRIEEVNSPNGDFTPLCRDAIGIILYGWIDRRYFDALSIFKLPLFVVGANPLPELLPGICFDYHTAALNSCRRLRGLGCRRIALINGAKHYLPAHDIHRALCENANETGEKVDESIVIWTEKRKMVEKYALIKNLLMRCDEFDALLVEKGNIQDTLFLARVTNLPKRIKMAFVIDNPFPSEFSSPDTMVEYCPALLFNAAVEVFMKRLDSGETDLIKQYLIAPCQV